MLKILFLTLMLISNSMYKTYLLSNLIMMMTVILFLLFSLLPTLSFNPVLSNFFTIDFMSFPLITLTVWISLLMLMASQNMRAMFILSRTILILMIILIFSFLINNFLLFFILFELSLIPTLVLILSWGYQPERIQAGTYLILYTMTASLPLMSGLLMLFNFNNSLFMLTSLLINWTNPFTHLWWLSITMAFLVKFPMFLTHLWLPKAHVEAPVAGSMILAGVLLKLGGYGIMRTNSMIWWATSNSMFCPILSSLSLWGAIITGAICIRQTDLKALIAYSSVGHMGLIIAGLMSSKTWGWNGAMAMMIAHGLSSSALFAIANMLYKSSKSRSIILNKGFLALIPSLTLWWFILTCSNMAAPPTLNLVSELMLLTSILSMSNLYLPLILLSTLIVGAYSLVMYSSTQHGHPPIFLNSMKLNLYLDHITLFLHVTPLLFFTLKLDMILPY